MPDMTGWTKEDVLAFEDLTKLKFLLKVMDLSRIKVSQKVKSLK